MTPSRTRPEFPAHGAGTRPTGPPSDVLRSVAQRVSSGRKASALRSAGHLAHRVRQTALFGLSGAGLVGIRAVKLFGASPAGSELGQDRRASTGSSNRSSSEPCALISSGWLPTRKDSGALRSNARLDSRAPVSPPGSVTRALRSPGVRSWSRQGEIISLGNRSPAPLGAGNLGDPREG